MERGGCVYIMMNHRDTTIYIGVISDVSEGESIDSAIENTENTKLSLKGIESGKSGGCTRQVKEIS